MPNIEAKKARILRVIDGLTGFTEKMEYLNGQYLKVSTLAEERMILGLIEQLKFWGK